MLTSKKHSVHIAVTFGSEVSLNTGSACSATLISKSAFLSPEMKVKTVLRASCLSFGLTVNVTMSPSAPETALGEAHSQSPSRSQSPELFTVTSTEPPSGPNDFSVGLTEIESSGFGVSLLQPLNNSIAAAAK